MFVKEGENILDHEQDDDRCAIKLVKTFSTITDNVCYT